MVINVSYRETYPYNVDFYYESENFMMFKTA